MKKFKEKKHEKEERKLGRREEERIKEKKIEGRE